MFCTNCGKQIDDDSSFCTFCGNEVNRSSTSVKNQERNKPEFETIFIEVPEKVQEAIPVIEKVEKETERKQVNSKYDETYEKDTMPTVVGSILAFTWLLLYIFNINKQYQSYEENHQALKTQDLITTLTIILRIAVTIWVVNIARFRNREPWSWGFLAFLFPAVALIFIGIQKRLKPKLKI